MTYTVNMTFRGMSLTMDFLDPETGEVIKVPVNNPAIEVLRDLLEPATIDEQLTNEEQPINEDV